MTIESITNNAANTYQKALNGLFNKLPKEDILKAIGIISIGSLTIYLATTATNTIKDIVTSK